MDGRESSADIERTAARWVARMDRAQPLPEEQAQLERWLSGDVRRRGAFIRARALWGSTEVLQGGLRRHPRHFPLEECQELPKDLPAKPD